MRLEPLYRLTFRYSRSWAARLEGELFQHLEGEGRCEGRIEGRFHGVNRARRAPGRPFEPDYNGVIETDDGAAILFHLSGYGWPEEGRVVATVSHVSDDDRYRSLNEAVCVAGGEVREREVTLQVAELIWEPIR